MSDIEHILKNYHKDLENRRDLELRVRQDIQSGALNPEKISKDFGKLRIEFSKVLDYLEERFQVQNREMAEINTQFFERKKQVEELHHIQVGADTLSEIKQGIKTKKEECIHLENKLKDLESNIEGQTKTWSEEKVIMEERIVNLMRKEEALLQKSTNLEKQIEKETIFRSEKIQKQAEQQKQLLDRELKQLEREAIAFSQRVAQEKKEAERQKQLLDEELKQLEQKALSASEAMKRELEAKKEAFQNEVNLHKEKMAQEKEAFEREIKEGREKLNKEIEEKRRNAEKQIIENEAMLLEKNTELTVLKAKVSEFPETLDRSIRNAERSTASQLIDKYKNLISVSKKEHNSNLETHKQHILMLETNQKEKDRILQKQEERIQQLEKELKVVHQGEKTSPLQLNQRAKESESVPLEVKPYSITQFQKMGAQTKDSPRIVRSVKKMNSNK